MPRSLIPCGQPKFNSKPSQPVSSERLTISCHASLRDSTISETMTVCFGYLRLHSRISRRLTSSGRSVMSSMLLSPIMRWLAPSMEARREETLRIGSPRVFQTAPPQPASNARSTIEPMFVGGAEASQKGLGDLMPAKSTLRSAIAKLLLVRGLRPHSSVSLNVLRLFRQGDARARELDALARERRVDALRGELAHLRGVDGLAAAVDAVAAREELRVAGLHRLGLDDDAARLVHFDAGDG